VTGIVVLLFKVLPGKDAQIPILLLVGIPVVILQVRYAPCYATVGIVTSDELLCYPLSPPPPLPESQQEKDEREYSEQVADWQDSKARLGTESAWKCNYCGEENPGEFDVCWKCQKERVASSPVSQHSRQSS
jgi:hypothetical protein